MQHEHLYVSWQRRDSMMSGSSEFIDMGEAWAGCLPEYPELGKMMARMVLDSCPEATFTSIMVSKDFNRGYHKDINNDANTRNYVIPVKVPSRGGALWVELQPGDVVKRGGSPTC